MVKITFIEHGGDRHTVDVKAGLTVMEAAVKNNIPGIMGDCGGAGACGTCHVYVDARWVEKTGARSDMEEDMLECAEEMKPTSRLSCQIQIDEGFEGLIIRLPRTQ